MVAEFCVEWPDGRFQNRPPMPETLFGPLDDSARQTAGRSSVCRTETTSERLLMK